MRLALAMTGMLAIAGCGGPAITRAPATPPCTTRTPATHPADTLTVVLFDTVDLSHAPWGRNREERFVFSHLYETLLTVDCHGQLQPGLAKRCVEASDGWLIEMRDDARFWDQTPVTAYDAVEPIKRAIAQGIAIASVDVVDEHSMILHGYSGRPDLKLLTLPMMAVTKAPSAGGIAIGTGPWMIDETVPVAEAVTIHPSSEDEYPIVRFVQGNVGDVRDILDGTADAMITDDPAAIEYARGKKTVSMAPLAWDRAYVLLSVTRATKLGRGEDVASLPRATREGLARDAVHVDARGESCLIADAEWFPIEFIGLPAGVLPGVLKHDKQILVRADDQTARGLAERIVALAATDTAGSADARAIVRAVPDAGLRPIRVEATTLAEFDSRLRSGGEFAYIDAVPCGDFAFVTHRFSSRAPWLFVGKPNLHTLVPLVETRAHFVAISDRIGYIDDHNGGVRILGPSVVKAR